LIKGLVTLTLSDGNVAERAERPATRGSFKRKASRNSKAATWLPGMKS